MFAKSKLTRVNLRGNQVTKKMVTGMVGFEAYSKRRKERMDQAVENNLMVDLGVCGLEE